MHTILFTLAVIIGRTYDTWTQGNAQFLLFTSKLINARIPIYIKTDQCAHSCSHKHKSMHTLLFT